MYTKTAVILSAASLVAQVSALGSAIIQNNCANDVYLWTVGNTPGSMTTIKAGDKYSEGYQYNPNGGGISMKLATEPDTSGPVTQFEYTVAGNLWYDISNINGFPFMKSGLTLTPSTSSCRSMICAAGVELCTAAYNQPDDNEATAACDQDSNMTLVLCSDDKASTPVNAVTSAINIEAVAPAAAPAATSAPAPVVAAAPAVTSAPVVIPQGNGGAVFTTFVTQIITVLAERAPAPSPEPVQKRAVHRHHMHRHAADSN